MSEKQEIRLAGFAGRESFSPGIFSGRLLRFSKTRMRYSRRAMVPRLEEALAAADVLISSETVHYPKVGDPTLLVIMSQGAWATYGSSLVAGGCSFWTRTW